MARTGGGGVFSVSQSIRDRGETLNGPDCEIAGRALFTFGPGGLLQSDVRLGGSSSLSAGWVNAERTRGERLGGRHATTGGMARARRSARLHHVGSPLHVRSTALDEHPDAET